MASLVEVAKAAGVSLTTASMVLNRTRQDNRVSQACADRVRAAAQRLGYVPNYHARSMKSGRAEMIAVALDIGFVGEKKPTASEVGSTYFGQLIGAMELIARNEGYQLTIVGPDEQSRAPDRGVVGMQQRRFDGLIVLGLPVRTEMTTFFADAPADLPIVVVESPLPTALPVINFNAHAGMLLTVEHLARLGHRELLWVQAGHDSVAAERLPQLAQLAASAGLRVSTLDVSSHGLDRSSYPLAWIEAVEAAVIGRFRQPTDRKTTAVVALNDVVAVGVCSALAKLDIRVPQDCSVVGFDDIEARLCIPRLTTVDHRLGEMGTRAANLILAMIKDPALLGSMRGSCETVTPTLVIRESTGPAPQA